MNPLGLVRSKFLRDTGGAPIFALGILCLLYFFDEFDTAAFGVLAPNIEHAFHLNDQHFILLVTANVSLTVLLAIPVGWLSDRVRRTPLVIISGVLAGLFSFGTGVVGTVALLSIMRLGNGLGLVANSTVHRSLLADYYPPSNRAQVFGDHVNAMYVGGVVGPAVAGGVASAAGWRAAFMILIVPILAVTFLATRLREPVRGESDDPESAAEVREEAVPFSEGVRTLWMVRTLRRQYYGSLFFGAGIVPLAAYLPLFLQRTFHVGAGWRGVIGSADALVTFTGVQWAARRSPRWFGRSMGTPLSRSAVGLALTGVGLAVLAASPTLPVAVVMGLLTSFAIGTFLPPFFAVQSLVSPARVRTLSFAFGSLFIVLGVFVLFYMTGLAKVSDTHGIRWGIGILTPFWLISGAFLASSARFVADDTNRALALLGTSAQLRRQRLEAGDRSLLLCTGVDVAYDSVQVLFGVDFDVTEGEIVALLGTNGAGKSTLLKAVSGLVNPIGGAIFFDGVDITHADARKAVGLGIIQVPGGRSIFPTLTVAECLRLSSWMYKRRDPAHVRQATAQVLEYFPVLRERWDQLAGNLSGGEQQMLGLGMAFIAKPRILLIDELSLGLAPTVVSRLVEIVKAIHADGTTVVIVEQSVNVALTLAQRAVFMEKGEVRFTGPTADLLEREDVLRSVFLEGAASHAPAAETTEAEPTRAPRTAAAARRRAREVEARREELAVQPVVLELRDVTRSFGGIRAVDEVSFQLRKGEILGLIGPNGAGKTTVFDLVSGFLSLDRGRILLHGIDVTSWAADRRSWAGLGRSFQDARLFPSLTVAECIALALERHLEFRDPLAAALCLPAVGDSEDAVTTEVDSLIELLGLGAYANKFVSELSTGSRRIVDLAMSMAHQPSVLILDEPSSGIAQRETEALGPVLRRIQSETGCSLLVIEHDMPLVTAIADTMIALDLGRVIAEGTPGEVVRHPEVVASYLGTDEAVVARSGPGRAGGNGRRASGAVKAKRPARPAKASAEPGS